MPRKESLQIVGLDCRERLRPAQVLQRRRAFLDIVVVVHAQPGVNVRRVGLPRRVHLVLQVLHGPQILQLQRLAVLFLESRGDLLDRDAIAEDWRGRLVDCPQCEERELAKLTFLNPSRAWISSDLRRKLGRVTESRQVPRLVARAPVFQLPLLCAVDAEERGPEHFRERAIEDMYSLDLVRSLLEILMDLELEIFRRHVTQLQATEVKGVVARDVSGNALRDAGVDEPLLPLFHQVGVAQVAANGHGGAAHGITKL